MKITHFSLFISPLSTSPNKYIKKIDALATNDEALEELKIQLAKEKENDTISLEEQLELRHD